MGASFDHDKQFGAIDRRTSPAPADNTLFMGLTKFKIPPSRLAGVVEAQSQINDDLDPDNIQVATRATWAKHGDMNDTATNSVADPITAVRDRDSSDEHVFIRARFNPVPRVKLGQENDSHTALDTGRQRVKQTSVDAVFVAPKQNAKRLCHESVVGAASTIASPDAADFARFQPVFPRTGTLVSVNSHAAQQVHTPATDRELSRSSTQFMVSSRLSRYSNRVLTNVCIYRGVPRHHPFLDPFHFHRSEQEGQNQSAVHPSLPWILLRS